jgi:hypothetical protein
MAFTVRVTKGASEGTTSISSTVDHTVETVTKMQEVFADGVTNGQVLVAIDVSQLKAFAMVSNVALTVKTNSSGSPQETFALVANKPVVWQEGEAAIFAGDVTQIFVTNASGSSATLQVMIGLNA